jgi:hypothetical protein
MEEVEGRSHELMSTLWNFKNLCHVSGEVQVKVSLASN